MSNQTTSATSAQEEKGIVSTNKGQEPKKKKSVQVQPIIIPVRQEQMSTLETTVSVKKEKSIDEITADIEKLELLRKKHIEIREKISLVDKFVISHDNNNAQLSIIDASSNRISTGNPKSIAQVLKIWTDDLKTALLQKEQEIRNLLEN